MANTILRATVLIISMAMQLVKASLHSSGILVNLSNFNIPQDVRMVYLSSQTSFEQLAVLPVFPFIHSQFHGSVNGRKPSEHAHAIQSFGRNETHLRG